ncbi:MAG: AgmX/PglI C-terminal domain-containing protein [Alphaproteobacteria bacterium]|nr:AgmX/PglI C-terminal domain-containing protein [Alphaproteobacteria bacterium]
MLPLLATLLSLSVGTAHAAPPASPTSWVMVDAHAWLYRAPDEQASRFRAVYVPNAPEYRSPPVLVARQVETRDGWVHLQTLTHAPHLDSNGRPDAPDVAPDRWPQCYPQPAALQQLELDVWVHDTDLLSMLTRTVTVTTPAGGTLTLEKGLTAAGHDGTYRVRSHHLTVLATLPDDAVGTHLPITADLPRNLGYVASGTGGSVRVLSMWHATIDARGDDLVIPASTSAPASGGTTTLLTDRCLALRPARPGPPVPVHDDEALAAGTGAPILVRDSTVVRDGAGERLGRVTGGDYPLWSRASCTYEAERGLCCDPLSGTESAGDGDLTMCFDAGMPVHVDATIDNVFHEWRAVMVRQAELSATLRPVVTWSRPEVRGILSPDTVAATFAADAEPLTYCYARALQRNPAIAGTLAVRFGVASDGRPRDPQVVDDGVGDEALRDCVFQRIGLMLIPDQVGEIASVVDMRLTFQGVPSTADAAPTEDRTPAPVQ